MTERIAVLLAKRDGIAAAPDHKPTANCAKVNVDRDAGWWTVVDQPGAFQGLFGATQGKVPGMFTSGVALDLYDEKESQIVLSLIKFNLNARPTMAGVAGCDVDPRVTVSTHFLHYTYYWRILSVPNMTLEERRQEVVYLISEEFLPRAQRKLRQYINWSAGAWMVILAAMMACPFATVVLAASILILGFSTKQIVADTHEMYALFYTAKTKMEAARSEQDLRDAAKAASDWVLDLVDLLVAAMGLTSATLSAARAVPKTAAEAQAAVQQARCRDTGSHPVQEGTARIKNRMRPRRAGPGETWKQRWDSYQSKVKREAQAADSARKRGDLVTANQHWLNSLESAIEASALLKWERYMDGHALVIESVGDWLGKHILPSLKGKNWKSMIRYFDTVGVTLKEAEAKILVGEVAAVDSFECLGHDTTSVFGKQMAYIAERMKFDRQLCPPEVAAGIVKILESGSIKDMETLLRDEAARGPESFRADMPDALKQKEIAARRQLWKWYKQGLYECIAKSIDVADGIREHNQEYHHTPREGVIEDSWESGLDSFHSKIMKGRDYQGAPQSIEAAQPRPNDSPQARAAILLAKLTFIDYVHYGGRYTLAQIVDCSTISRISKTGH